MSFNKYINSISVEPCFFFFNLALLLTYPAFNALIYMKAREYVMCSYMLQINESYNLSPLFPDVNLDVCRYTYNDIEKPTNFLNISSNIIEIETQKLAADYIFYTTLSSTIPALCLALIISPWAEKNGREKPILFPFIGAMGQAIIYACMTLLPQLTINYAIIGSTLYGLFGGIVIQMLGLFTYISYYSNNEQRTIKFAILEAFGFLGVLSGSLLSGILLKMVPLYLIFVITFIINGLAFLYLIIYSYIKRKDLTYSSITIILNPEVPKYSFIQALFLPIYKNTKLKKLLLLTITLNIITFVTIGEYDTTYLFVVHRFNWTASLYGYLIASWNVGEIFSLIVILPVLKKLAFGDLIVAVIGLVSKMAGLIVLGLASSTSMVFIAMLVSMMDSIPSTALRSSLSKVVASEDLGKLFAVIAATESITSIGSSLFFTRMYSYSLTMTKFGGNGMVYFVGAILLAITIVGFVPALYESSKKFGASKSQMKAVDGSCVDDSDGMDGAKN